MTSGIQQPFSVSKEQFLCTQPTEDAAHTAAAAHSKLPEVEAEAEDETAAAEIKISEDGEEEAMEQDAETEPPGPPNVD